MTPILTRISLAGGALLLAAGLSGFDAPAAFAHDYKLGALSIGHPWARASAGPARNGAAFLVIENTGAADRLIAVSGEVSERAELHHHMMAGDVMKMRRVEAVEVPANGTAALQPGGLHIMLIGLKQPLQEGERFPLTLTFEAAGEVTVEVAVEGVAGMGPQGGMDHGEMDHGTMAPAN
jgi:copper(I)-binding protein